MSFPFGKQISIYIFSNIGMFEKKTVHICYTYIQLHDFGIYVYHVYVLLKQMPFVESPMCKLYYILAY